MDIVAVIVFVTVLVSATTVAGLVWRSRQGKAVPAVRAGSSGVDPIAPATFGEEATPARYGERATLVQFSTEFCSSCPSTRRVLSEISDRATDVAYLDVDVTHRADLVRRFSILQTPTTLILDRDGVVRTRIGGAVRRTVVENALQELA